MQQTCFCGWTGQIEELQVVSVGFDEYALQCPRCGRHDRLEWLSEPLRKAVFRFAAERDDHARIGSKSLLARR